MSLVERNRSVGNGHRERRRERSSPETESGAEHHHQFVIPRSRSSFSPLQHLTSSQTKSLGKVSHAASPSRAGLDALSFFLPDFSRRRIPMRALPFPVETGAVEGGRKVRQNRTCQMVATGPSQFFPRLFYQSKSSVSSSAALPAALSLSLLVTDQIAATDKSYARAEMRHQQRHRFPSCISCVFYVENHPVPSTASSFPILPRTS